MDKQQSYLHVPAGELLKQKKISQDNWWNQYIIEIRPDDRNYVSFLEYIVLKLDGFLGDI